MTWNETTSYFDMDTLDKTHTIDTRRVFVVLVALNLAKKVPPGLSLYGRRAKKVNKWLSK